jgi:hypothetical protein
MASLTNKTTFIRAKRISDAPKMNTQHCGSKKMRNCYESNDTGKE